jgi:hypothetical protein
LYSRWLHLKEVTRPTHHDEVRVCVRTPVHKTRLELLVLGRCIYREPRTVFFTPRGSLASDDAGSNLSLATFMRPKVLYLCLNHA